MPKVKLIQIIVMYHLINNTRATLLNLAFEMGNRLRKLRSRLATPSIKWAYLRLYAYLVKCIARVLRLA